MLALADIELVSMTLALADIELVSMILRGLENQNKIIKSYVYLFHTC